MSKLTNPSCGLCRWFNNWRCMFSPPFESVSEKDYCSRFEAETEANKLPRQIVPSIEEMKK